MPSRDPLILGIDLGGTKILTAVINPRGEGEGWGCKNTRDALLTPHPGPLPQGERDGEY